VGIRNSQNGFQKIYDIMKKRLKKIILLGTILTILTTMSAFGQNQFADYVKHLKDNQPELTPLSTFVMSWYGVRYKLGGNTKRGIDCSQFTKKLYWEVYGLKLGNNCAEQWKQTKRIKKADLKIGDIVFFNSRQSPSGWHCGLYLGEDTFVHAANKEEGVKISSLSEPRYLRSYKGAGRLN
jgi:cell wall-associated NlpC family hydrolase